MNDRVEMRTFYVAFILTVDVNTYIGFNLLYVCAWYSH